MNIKKNVLLKIFFIQFFQKPFFPRTKTKIINKYIKRIWNFFFFIFGKKIKNCCWKKKRNNKTHLYVSRVSIKRIQKTNLNRESIVRVTHMGAIGVVNVSLNSKKNILPYFISFFFLNPSIHTHIWFFFHI